MRPVIVNRTKFAVDIMDPEKLAPRLPLSALLVKAAFQIGVAGFPLRLEQQPSSFCGDLLSEDEKGVSVYYESDFVPFKPRADALCGGKAYAPGRPLAPECTIGFGVGAWFKTIRVVGNRRWVPALGGLSHRMTYPEPFESLVVSYENAFGGRDAGKPDGFRFYAPNPIGKGYSEYGGGLNDLPLPNLEDPNDPIKSWRSRPLPMSFGPVGRHWQPRIQRAGTYDKRWLKERSPKLPEDFDEAFYNCAPADQQIPGYLSGDEEVRVQNMHPQLSDFRFRLPGIRIRALLDKMVVGRNQFEEITMNLDTLWVDMEALQMVLVWRGRISATGLEGQGPILIMEEQLNSAPRPPESYRPELQKHLEEENEAELEVEAAERELAEREHPKETSLETAPEVS